MKHLKTILIVIVTLALIATSVIAVIAADANEELTGVKKLEALIDDVDKADDAEAQSAILRNFYVYHDSVEWTGNEEGYAECMAVAANRTVTIGRALYDAYLETKADASLSDGTKIVSLKALNAHFIGCKAPVTTGGLEDLLGLLETENLVFTEKFYNDYQTNVGMATPNYVSADASIFSLYDLIADCYPISDEAKLANYEAAAAAAVERAFDKYNAIPKDSDFESEDTESVEKVAAYRALKEKETTNLENQIKNAADPEAMVKKLAYFDRTNDILVIEGYIELTDIDEAEGDAYATLVSGINAARAARDAEIAAKAAALDAEASFDDYDLRVIFNKNYDGELSTDRVNALPAAEREKYKAENDLFTGHNGNSEYTIAQLYEGEGDKKNGFQSFIYPDTTTAVKHLYMDSRIDTLGENDGLVVEFDLRLTKTFAGFTIYASDDSYGAGNTHFTNDPTTLIWGGETSNIYLRTHTAKKEKTDTYGAVQNGVWQHYTFTYDTDDNVGVVYINYEYIGEIFWSFPDLQNDKIRGLRIGPSSVTNFGWDIDNFQAYCGKTPRQLDKLSSMTPDQLFKFYVDYAADATNTNYLNRNSAYKRAEILLPQYESKPAFKSYVDKFKAIDYESAIKNDAMKLNLDNLADLVNKLDTPNSKNITLVQEAIDKINRFVSKNGELINKADTSEDGYQSLMGEVYAKQAIIDHVNNAIEFVEAVNKFDRATTLVALKRHSDSANEIYKNAGFEDPEIWNIVKNDPAVTTFEETYNNGVVDINGKTVVLKEGQVLVDTLEVLDYSEEIAEAYEILRFYLPPSDESYVTISELYATFESQILSRSKYESSRRIVNCIDYMLSLEGYEATPEFWGANKDTIAPYMTIIRGIVNAGGYDNEYEGIDEALAVFYEADVYFYEILQQQHIETLNEYLARYTATESYIERFSAVKTVEKYIESEDLATENTTLSNAVREAVADEIEALESIKITYNVYKGELAGLESAFEDVLAQQTQYFINTINYMNTLTSYKELAEQFDIATTYYNAINLDTPEALEAAESYREYRDSLAAIRESSLLFVAGVKKINDAAKLTGIEGRNAMYTAIKYCMQYADDLVDNDRSTSQALEVYEAAVAEYNAGNAAIADAAFEAGQFVNATRASEIPATVLAVISFMLGN